MGHTFHLLGDEGLASRALAGSWGAAEVGGVRSSSREQLGFTVLSSHVSVTRLLNKNKYLLCIYFLLGGSGRIDVGDEVKGAAKTIEAL